MGAMLSMTEVIATHTALSDDDTAWLVGLVDQWGMLSDLAFSDLILMRPWSRHSGGAPERSSHPTQIQKMAQIHVAMPLCLGDATSCPLQTNKLFVP